jgi:ribosomal protein L37AE/L43A
MRYVAVVCPRCGKASGARSDAKRHQCPYCGAVFQIDNASILAMGNAKTIRETVVRYNSGEFKKP